jgi:hypothetical protein
VDELDWHLPRDIQAECIPLILGGGDVMAVINSLKNLFISEIDRLPRLVPEKLG